MAGDPKEPTAGATLGEARAASGISLEQVARDTHISTRYLEALEEGDYSVFPGPAYVTGFIRSYASYLELDPQPLIDDYRMQQSEKPHAPEELSRAGAGRRSPLVAVLALALLVFAAGVFALVRWVIVPAGASERTSERPQDAPVRPFVMASDAVIRVLEVGSVLHVPIGDRLYVVLLARYDDGLVIEYGDREVLLAIGGEVLLDLAGDSRTDLRVLLNSVDRTGPTIRVNLTLQRDAGREQGSLRGGTGEPGRSRLT